MQVDNVEESFDWFKEMWGLSKQFLLAGYLSSCSESKQRIEMSFYCKNPALILVQETLSWDQGHAALLSAEQLSCGCFGRQSRGRLVFRVEVQADSWVGSSGPTKTFEDAVYVLDIPARSASAPQETFIRNIANICVVRKGIRKKNRNVAFHQMFTLYSTC